MWGSPPGLPTCPSPPRAAPRPPNALAMRLHVLSMHVLPGGQDAAPRREHMHMYGTFGVEHISPCLDLMTESNMFGTSNLSFCMQPSKSCRVKVTHIIAVEQPQSADPKESRCTASAAGDCFRESGFSWIPTSCRAVRPTSFSRVCHTS